MHACEILLVEDNPADVLLIREAFKEARIGNPQRRRRLHANCYLTKPVDIDASCASARDRRVLADPGKAAHRTPCVGRRITLARGWKVEIQAALVVQTL